MIEQLPTAIPPDPDKPELAGPDHPIRKATRQIAFEPGGWTKDRAEKVGQLFDTMAAGWAERTSAERRAPLQDALARGRAAESGLCVEVGSGTGSSLPDLTARFDTVIACDLSRAMLANTAPGDAHCVQGDGSCLPLADGAADCIVLVNCFLFPTEIERVLSPSGSLVWASSLGDRTPIYLPAEDVEKALPGTWDGFAAEAGWGTWCTLRRRSVA